MCIQRFRSDLPDKGGGARRADRRLIPYSEKKLIGDFTRGSIRPEEGPHIGLSFVREGGELHPPIKRGQCQVYEQILLRRFVSGRPGLLVVRVPNDRSSALLCCPRSFQFGRTREAPRARVHAHGREERPATGQGVLCVHRNLPPATMGHDGPPVLRWRPERNRCAAWLSRNK